MTEFLLNDSRLSGSRIAPPPSAMTRPLPEEASITTCLSIRLNDSSPPRAKISVTLRPEEISTISSVSTKDIPVNSEMMRPTVVFPDPMKPARAMFARRI